MSKKILIRAEQPAGNIALLENQLTEVLKNYLASENKEGLVEPYKGMPMILNEVKIKSDANYVVKISLEEMTR